MYKFQTFKLQTFKLSNFGALWNPKLQSLKTFKLSNFQSLKTQNFNALRRPSRVERQRERRPTKRRKRHGTRAATRGDGGRRGYAKRGDTAGASGRGERRQLCARDVVAPQEPPDLRGRVSSSPRQDGGRGRTPAIGGHQHLPGDPTTERGAATTETTPQPPTPGRGATPGALALGEGPLALAEAPGRKGGGMGGGPGVFPEPSVGRETLRSLSRVSWTGRRATNGTSNRSRLSFRRARAQPMAQAMKACACVCPYGDGAPLSGCVCT